ncbi:MAG: cob(I)yrinic acid a,c-diamide adenosyltransferase [Gammaproteobacteria bacterium]|nr:cob(I)yrinic acid a,c-diamide adenosyltransferase [Gammaproteobacteria bacterium]
MSQERPRISKVTTRQGDQGTTQLADGRSYSKADPRLELVGELDELNSALGVAGLHVDAAAMQAQLQEIQSRVFDIGAAVATGQPQPVWQRELEKLDDYSEKINADLEPLAEFVLPGGNLANAQLHVARTIARRCERAFWRVNDAALISAGIGAYLNRISDFLFIAARSVSSTEVLWQPLQE